MNIEAIEWCIDGWDERESGDGRAAKAREQLAALVEAAGRAAALTKVAQIVVDCRDMRADEFRDTWGVGSWGDYYERLTELADAALAGGGGAAGARDETERKAAAFDKVACYNCHGYGRTERPGSPPDSVACISCGGTGVKGPGMLERFPLDFDAPRAGGAGDR